MVEDTWEKTARWRWSLIVFSHFKKNWIGLLTKKFIIKVENKQLERKYFWWTTWENCKMAFFYLKNHVLSGNANCCILFWLYELKLSSFRHLTVAIFPFRKWSIFYAKHEKLFSIIFCNSVIRQEMNDLKNEFFIDESLHFKNCDEWKLMFLLICLYLMAWDDGLKKR